MKRKMVTAVVLMVVILAMVPLASANHLCIYSGFPEHTCYQVFSYCNMTINYSFSIEYTRILMFNRVIYNFDKTATITPYGGVYGDWDNDNQSIPRFARVHAELRTEGHRLVCTGYIIFGYTIFDTHKQFTI